MTASMKALPLTLLLLLSGCFLLDGDRPQPERALPPPTMEGLDRFGCRIDGLPYVPRSMRLGRPRLTVIYDPATDQLLIRTNNVKGKGSFDQALDLVVKPLTTGDTLWLGPPSGRRQPPTEVGYAYYADYNGSGEYFTSQVDSLTYSGYVYLTGMDLDTAAAPRYVAGTFAMMLRDSVMGTVVEVSEGRFDVSLPR